MKHNINTNSKIMLYILDRIPESWSDLSESEKMKLLYPSDFFLVAEERGEDLSIVFQHDNEDAPGLTAFIQTVVRVVPVTAQLNSESEECQLPSGFWLRLGVKVREWQWEKSTVAQKRNAHIDILNLLVPNLKAFVAVGSLFLPIDDQLNTINPIIIKK